MLKNKPVPTRFRESLFFLLLTGPNLEVANIESHIHVGYLLIPDNFFFCEVKNFKSYMKSIVSFFLLFYT